MFSFHLCHDLVTPEYCKQPAYALNSAPCMYFILPGSFFLLKLGTGYQLLKFGLNMSSGSLFFKPLEDLAVLGPESYVDILGAPEYMVLAVGWPRVEFHPTVHCAPCYLIPGLSLWCVKSKRPPCRSSLPPDSQLQTGLRLGDQM